jgi:hypothetical protein
MRKTHIEMNPSTMDNAEAKWIDLSDHATAEISSEDPNHPLEHALEFGSNEGWRAASPGKQKIRFIFDSPQQIKRIRLEFIEEEVSRSQEFALHVTTLSQPRREILRQQWSFSPEGSTIELESYTVDLHGVTMIDLEIDPGRHDMEVFASLRAFLLG